jgi:hypothetical protein
VHDAQHLGTQLVALDLRLDPARAAGGRAKGGVDAAVLG